LRSHHPLAKWGKKLLARKGSRNLAAGAVARKLAVAIWYLLMGRWTPLEEIDERLALKVGKNYHQRWPPKDSSNWAKPARPCERKPSTC